MAKPSASTLPGLAALLLTPSPGKSRGGYSKISKPRANAPPANDRYFRVADAINRAELKNEESELPAPDGLGSMGQHRGWHDLLLFAGWLPGEFTRRITFVLEELDLQVVVAFLQLRFT